MRGRGGSGGGGAGSAKARWWHVSGRRLCLAARHCSAAHVEKVPVCVKLEEDVETVQDEQAGRDAAGEVDVGSLVVVDVEEQRRDLQQVGVGSHRGWRRRGRGGRRSPWMPASGRLMGGDTRALGGLCHPEVSPTPKRLCLP